MKKKQKLELTWIGKDERPKLEPRILIEDADKSYHAEERRSCEDIFDNMLIHGDNLLALKALEQDYAGKVKCIYIDPPYNTGSAFDHYDDGLEHSIWLNLMYQRLVLLRKLLTQDGAIWISIGDNEAHYLKIIMDEIFGRTNFVTTNIWQMIYTTKNSARHFSGMHEYVLVYAKDIDKFTINLLPRDKKQDKAYKNPDQDARGVWKSTPLHARNYYGAGQYKILSPGGIEISPPSGTYWRISEENFHQLNEDNRIWWGKDGASTPSQKRFLSEVKQGVTPATLWLHEDVGHNGEAKNEIRAILSDVGETFLTPKPERLLKRILELGSNPGDLVLDSFAGSGTTGAVAQKMARRWVMIELGEHCNTHIIPRIKKVINGVDKGGITETVGWSGGGGFRYYRLAPSLLEKDKYDNWIISKAYRPEMLAEAMCKNMGFHYEPSRNAEEYWLHGYSTEADFIYVTTQSLTHAALKKISEDVGPDRSLLICCKAFKGKANAFENLTIIKIPQTILKKCEWGRDDYSLNIENLPMMQEEQQDDRPKQKTPDDLPLFADQTEKEEA